MTIFISDGNQTIYKCVITLKIDFEFGMKYYIILIKCKKEKNHALAINSEVGIYQFTLNLEGMDIGCQFAGVYRNSEYPLSKNSIQDSIKCNSYCKTIGGPDKNKPCVFPFISNGRRFDKCTNIEHPSTIYKEKLYCATEVNETGVMKIGKWGTCSRTCGFCFGTVIDVSKASNSVTKKDLRGDPGINT